MRSMTVVAAVVVAAAGLAACGQSGGPASYLGASSSQIDFIQWQASSGGALQGTLTADMLTGSAPAETLAVNNASFTGTLRGTSVTLSFSGLFFGQSFIYGTLNGTTLTLRVPQSDGTIQAATFARSGVAAYNKAVASLHTRIRQANLLARQAQAQQQQQQANAQAEQGAQNDLSTLQQDASFSSDLSALSSDVQSAGSDLGTLKSDAAQGAGSYCTNVFTVADDAMTVDDDLYTLSDDLSTFTSDLATARQAITTVNTDIANLQASGLPAPAGAAADITAARQAIQSAITAANGDISQADTYDRSAFAIADGMATGSCSGDGPGSPSALINPIK